MKSINQLTQIDITSGSNGYPENIRLGYIGFDTLEEADQFATETNGRVRLFHKRDGWQFYESKGDMFKPLTADNYIEDLGDNYYSVDADSIRELINDNVLEVDDDKLISFLKDQVEILEELEKASDDQTVICGYGKYYETVDNEMMSYHEDVHTYEIGVEVENDS